MSIVATERPLDVSALWRAARLPVVLVVIGLALVTIFAAIGRAPNTTPLDPRNTSPDGTHALAALLGDRGVAVSVVDDLSALHSSGATTIVVAKPGDLSARALRTISASTATVLLISPLSNALSAFEVPATPDSQTPATTIAAGCALPAAVTAGPARIEGDLYAVSGTATRCYLQGGDAALTESTRSNGATTIVFGSGPTFTNAQLAAQGNAALGLGLLNTPVVQWVPGGLHAGPVPRSRRGLFNLLPSRLLWATLQLFLVLVVLAFGALAGSANRSSSHSRSSFGPPRPSRAGPGCCMPHMPEALPPGPSCRGRASAQPLIRVGPDEDAGSVAALVAQRTHQPVGSVRHLLYGGEPPDDARSCGWPNGCRSSRRRFSVTRVHPQEVSSDEAAGGDRISVPARPRARR